MAQGDYVEALATVRSAISKAPSDYRVRYYSGMALLGLQRFDEARTETELALSLAPEADKAGVQRLLDTIALQSVSLKAEADAEAALAAGLNGRAARLFAQAFEADNTKIEAGFRAASLYASSLSQPVEAVKVLRKLEVQPASPEARTRAANELKKLEPVYTPFVLELVARAKSLFDAGEVSEAAFRVSEAAVLDPRRREVVIEQIRLTALGNDDRALEAAFLDLSKYGVSIEAVIPVLPRGKYWSEQGWFTQLLKDYQGTEYSAAVVTFLQGQRKFRDCPSCPEMVVLPPGQFTMAANNKTGRRVRIERPFAISNLLITHDQYNACVFERACPAVYVLDRKTGPFAVGVSRESAQSFVSWLSKKTGKRYRLLSEAEWEYAARAGTTTKYYWGNGPEPVHCDYASPFGDGLGCGPNYSSSPVGMYKPNPWGLFDLYLTQWVEDCYSESDDLKSDGSAYLKASCSSWLVRGWWGALGRNSFGATHTAALRIAREL
ncbi:MAG: SUMF1/EgtB/PvdO family nonheme iron enzyme [Hyphomonadaceae bacterium]